nr:MAPEG family protein [Jannaschia sp. LMIT008]
MDQFEVRRLTETERAVLTIRSISNAYSHALASLAGWAILMTILGALSVIGKPRARTSSGMPQRDYSDPYYRRDRAFRNAIETTGPFVAALLAAVLTGTAPFWVNLFASVFLVARIATAAVHIGTEIQPLRSAFWSVGTLCILVLALMGLWGALT